MRNTEFRPPGSTQNVECVHNLLSAQRLKLYRPTRSCPRFARSLGADVALGSNRASKSFAIIGITHRPRRAQSRSRTDHSRSYVAAAGARLRNIS